MTLCILRDCTLAYIDEEGIVPPIPGAIDTVAELAAYLHAASVRSPFALRMDLPGEYRAWIHIGGPLGAVNVTKVYLSQPIPTNAPGAWQAMPDRALPLSVFVAFLTEGSQAEDDICGDHLLPVGEVIQIATYLAEHRALPTTHGWVRHYGNGTCTYVAKATPSVPTSDEPFSPSGQFLCDDESYLKAITATPNDRLLRRLYADWLEALKPPRTELIRVCEAMRDVPVWSDRYWELKARRNELWEQLPLDWLEATGYDGSYYDPVFRDGVPDGVRERWRLIREFTERWHGITVPDVGGRQAEIAQAEARLGLTLPPSLREFVAYVHDLGDCSRAHDPLNYNTVFHSAYFLLHHLHRHSALSLIHFTLDSGVLGIAREDLADADPCTYFFDEIVDENGAYFPPPSTRPHQSPSFCAASLSLSIFQCLFIQLPRAGNLEEHGANLDEWLPRLATEFPIHARFDDAHIFESNEMLVLITRRGDRTEPEYLVEALIRRPIPPESVPAILFGRATLNTGSSGMLTPASFRRDVDGLSQAAHWQLPANPAQFDLKLYIEWVRYAGNYPLWLSILRRRDAMHRAANYHEDLEPAAASPPAPRPFALDGDIPF
jgi:uncharacterized protein (TIGR02996 family)